MAYDMKLNDEPFQKIRDGKKTIELRLYDEKRRKLSIGDYIVFSKVDNMDEKIAVKIKALYRAQSFRELFEDISLDKCGNDADATIEGVVSRLRKYYSEEEEAQYGVLGIKIRVCDLEEVMAEEERLAEAQFEHYFPDGMK